MKGGGGKKVSSMFSGGRSEKHMDFTLKRAIFPLRRQSSGAVVRQ